MSEQLELYFNSTSLSGDGLKERKARSGSQNEKILDFFRKYPGNLTPWEVQALMNLHNTPITSIRRAMTSLTHLGYLKRTSVMRPGLYGDMCYTWTLSR